MAFCQSISKYFSCFKPQLNNNNHDDHLEQRLQDFIKQEISKQGFQMDEYLNWKRAMEKRIETVEQAQDYMKTTSAQQNEKVQQLTRDVEDMQDNVFVEVNSEE